MSPDGPFSRTGYTPESADLCNTDRRGVELPAGTYTPVRLTLTRFPFDQGTRTFRQVRCGITEAVVDSSIKQIR